MGQGHCALALSYTHTHTLPHSPNRDTSHTHTQASGVECVTHLCHLVRGHYLLSMQIYVGRHGDVRSLVKPVGGLPKICVNLRDSKIILYQNI